MKINLSVFKDKDAKDAVTYQSWRWIRPCTSMWGVEIAPSYHMLFGPLQGYPGE